MKLSAFSLLRDDKWASMRPSILASLFGIENITFAHTFSFWKCPWTWVAKVILQKSKFAGRHPTSSFLGRSCFGFISLRIDSPLAFLLRGIRPYVQEAILGFILEVLSLLAPRSFFFLFAMHDDVFMQWDDLVYAFDAHGWSEMHLHEAGDFLATG